MIGMALTIHATFVAHYQTTPFNIDHLDGRLWRDVVEAYSGQYQYELRMVGHNKIAITPEAALNNPDRILVSLYSGYPVLHILSARAFL